MNERAQGWGGRPSIQAPTVSYRIFLSVLIRTACLVSSLPVLYRRNEPLRFFFVFYKCIYRFRFHSVRAASHRDQPRQPQLASTCKDDFKHWIPEPPIPNLPTRIDRFTPCLQCIRELPVSQRIYLFKPENSDKTTRPSWSCRQKKNKTTTKAKKPYSRGASNFRPFSHSGGPNEDTPKLVGLIETSSTQIEFGRWALNVKKLKWNVYHLLVHISYRTESTRRRTTRRRGRNMTITTHDAYNNYDRSVMQFI